MKHVLFLLTMLIGATSFGFSQAEMTTKELKKSYHKSVEHYSYNAFRDYFMTKPDVPNEFENLSYRQQQLLRWSYLNPNDNFLENLNEIMPIEPGDVVADIGIGNGTFEALLYLSGIDNIKIIGLDIDSVALTFVPRILNFVKSFQQFYNSAMQVAGNNDEVLMPIQSNFELETRLNTEDSTFLATESIDKMLCIRTLHHLSPKFIADMFRSLKPGGQIFIVESTPKKSQKQKCKDDGEQTFYLTYDEIVAQMESAGFELGDAITEKKGGCIVFLKPLLPKQAD